MAKVILDKLESFKIDMLYMCGQGYDGASSMSGHVRGVQAIICEKFPQARYVHCSAHTLNLALAHACTVQPIRNCIGTVTSITNFLRGSSQRTKILRDKVTNIHGESVKRGSALLAMCETRWVQRHDSLLRFVYMYLPVLHTLEVLQENKNLETSSKATQLLCSMEKSEFIVSLIVCKEIFSLTLPISKALQKVNCDLSQATDNIENDCDVLSSMHENAEEKFKQLFTSEIANWITSPSHYFASNTQIKYWNCI